MPTPLDAHLDARGAVRVPHQPDADSFGDPVAEHRAVRTKAGWVHQSFTALMALAGKDRVEWLQGLFSNDLAKLVAGGGCYGVHLTVKGKMVADFSVHARAEELVLATHAWIRAPLIESLDRYLIREEVEIQDRAETWTTVGVHGPRARAIAAAALGGSLPELPEYAFVERPFTGATVLAVRAAWTGEEGWELHVPQEHAIPLYDAIAAAGEREGGMPIGRAAARTLRVEAGRPWYGEDMDENTIPIEAGLEHRGISYTKGCYVGQEVIARIHSQGHVNRHLRGLFLAGAPLPVKGDKLKQADREVGWVTTAVVSPTLNREIALAYVRRDQALPGTKLTVDGTNGPLTAEVVELPFAF